MSDFPEPLSFNGNPGEGDGPVNRRTGPRVSYDGPPEPLRRCRRCGDKLITPITIDDHYGDVCGVVCRDALLRELSEKTA